MFLRVTLKTKYTAFADDLTAITQVSIIPIPTALVIRNWDTVLAMINELKRVIKADLDRDQTAPRDISYFTSFSL